MAIASQRCLVFNNPQMSLAQDIVRNPKLSPRQEARVIDSWSLRYLLPCIHNLIRRRLWISGFCESHLDSNNVTTNVKIKDTGFILVSSHENDLSFTSCCRERQQYCCEYLVTCKQHRPLNRCWQEHSEQCPSHY